MTITNISRPEETTNSSQTQPSLLPAALAVLITVVTVVVAAIFTPLALIALPVVLCTYATYINRNSHAETSTSSSPSIT